MSDARECPKCRGRRRDQFGEECSPCGGTGEVSAVAFPLARPVRTFEERTPEEVAAVRKLVGDCVKSLTTTRHRGR